MHHVRCYSAFLFYPFRAMVKPMPINWKATQKNLVVKPDGIAGGMTYGALVDIVGQPCQPVADCLKNYAAQYGQDRSPARLANFVAQIANETGGFTRWEENLNYSIKGMMQTWPTHFSLAKAQACVGQPQKIAECAYGGRMGNGPEGSGDGYLFRGRGALQLTGRSAYQRFGDLLGIDLVSHPDLAADPYDGTRIALEFFKQLKVNAAIDVGDFVKARRLCNGGTIGLDHVMDLQAKLLKVIV